MARVGKKEKRERKREKEREKETDSLLNCVRMEDLTKILFKLKIFSSNLALWSRKIVYRTALSNGTIWGEFDEAYQHQSPPKSTISLFNAQSALFIVERCPFWLG